MKLTHENAPFNDRYDIKYVTDQILQFYIDLFIEFEATNTKMFCWLMEEKLERAEKEISVQGQLLLWT